MNENPNTEDHLSTRRGSLVKLGGFLVTAMAAGGAKSVLSDGASAATDGSGPAAVASGAVACVLTPELTEGPYYLPGEKVRRNITEGRPGTALTLRLTVVNASTCKPIKGANVDIWHADAGGTYSGVQSSVGTTFMRGIQPTDAKGVAVFQTVYPGWYQGRAVHIHVKVHLGGNVVHTGQLFFPDTLTDTVYKAAPYNTRGARDTRNANDSIFVNGGKRSLLALGRKGTGYVGAITMGVHRS
jgi:protocatechuate 3,4-dioxygenase beta subunit